MISSVISPNLFHNSDPNKPVPLPKPHDSNNSLFFENMSGSLPQQKGLTASIVSPENPLKHILNLKIDDKSLSLGLSQFAMQSPQINLPGTALPKVFSHHFEDSIELNSNNESPTIKPLPMISHENKSSFMDLELGNRVNNSESAQLKGSAMIKYNPQINTLKASGFMMQSPQLEALESYIIKANENEKDKNESRPSSGGPLIEKESPEIMSAKSNLLKTPNKSSPLKKWQKKMEEERMALIESMLKEENEKRDGDEELKKNDEEMLGYEKKIDEEIKSGMLKNAKNFEKENNIQSFKKVYHRLFLFNEILRRIYLKYLFINLVIDKIFAKFCTCFKGRIYISKYSFVIAFFFSIAMIGYILGTNDAEYKTRSRTIHPLKKYMAANLLKASFIITYYGVFFIQIRYYFIIVLLFFIQFLPCLILLLTLSMNFFVFKSIDNLPADQYIPEIFFASIYLFWLLVYFVKEDIKRNCSETKKILLLIFWFVFGASIFIGITVYQIAISKIINIRWYHNYVATLCVPWVIFICINWVYLHIRFIVPIVKKYRKKTLVPHENSLKKLTIMPKKSFGDFLDVSEKLIEKQEENRNLYRKSVLIFENILKRFSRFLISIASFSTFGAMISTTIYCLFYIIYETNEYITDPLYPMNNSGLLCCSLLVLVIPIIFLIGIPLIGSNLDLKNKLFLFPIFGLVLPICITLPIANSLQSDSDFETFTSYLIFGPPCISIFWLFLIYISQHGRRILFFVTTFFCLFFVVPLGFLSPLINAHSFFNSEAARAAMILLLVIGSFILAIYLLYLFMRRFGQSYLLTKKEFARQPKFELLNYFRLDCQNFGLFGNGVGFIITITILIFGIFNKPDYIKPSQEGSLSGLVIVVCLLFIFLTLIIRMPVVNPEKVYSHSLNDQFEKEFQSEHSSLVQRQGFVRLGILIFGFVVMPIIFIPIIVVERDHDDTKYLLLTALIGNIVILLIFMMFYSIKKNYEEYGKSLIPGLSIFCWFFVFLPFVAIIPITVVNLRMEEDIAELYKITVGVAALIIFLGVGTLAIIGNLFFKRIEFEKKFKFVAGKVIKMLKKQHVRSDYDVIRLAYEDYLTKGPTKSEENMGKAKPIYYVKSSKFNPQTEFSKILISEANLKKLKHRQVTTKEQLEEELRQKKLKRNQCLQALINACCPIQELSQQQENSDKVNAINNNEEMENIQIIKEIEEEVLSQGSSEENDHIYDNGKSNKPQKEKEDELGEAFNDILVNNFIKTNEEAGKKDLDPEVKLLKNLKARDLDPRIWNALKFYDFTANLGVNEKMQMDLLKIVFKMFAFGDRQRVTVPWIDFVCYKELLRLAKIIPCDEIPDFMIDLTYTQFTTKDTNEFCSPILEYNFKEILARIAVLKFQDDSKEDAYNKLLRYYIFPLVLWNIPEMQLHYPHEWEYVLFLLNLYGLNEDSSEAQAISQKKRENELLLKQMGGMILLEKEEAESERKKAEADNLKKLEIERVLAEESEKKRLDEEIRKRKLEEEEEKRKDEEEFQAELRRKQEELEKLKKLEKERKNKERRKILKYWICIKLSELCTFFFQSFCLIQTRGDLENEQDDEKPDEADFHYAVDTLIAISNKKRTYTHLESPPWQDIVHSMVEFFPLAEEEYLKKKLREESLVLQNSWTNFTAVISKVFEIYSMGSIALRGEINWNLSPGAITVLNSLNNNIPQSDFPKYKFFFWFSFGLSVIYWFIGYKAVSKIKKGTFGVSGKKSLFNKDFLFTLFINITSATFYMIIMKSFIDTFSCNYDVKPWTLYEDSTLNCNEETHYIYVFLAGLGILLYYPLSSFLFPNIQFQNKSLDLKYDPTFIVISTQVKLLICGTASFFPSGNGLIIQLTISTIALFGLAFVDKIMKPCLVKRYNTLEVGAYLIAGWMCLSALINVASGDAFIATIIIIVGPICIALITIFIFVKQLKKINRLREERKKKKLEESPNNLESENVSSPDKSPISSIPNSKQKNAFDFSKKVNEFDDFSLGSSPIGVGRANNTIKKEFKIQMKELEKNENEEKKNDENNKSVNVEAEEEKKE